MATNISTVGATARDYATITLWEAATDPAVGDVEVGECYDDANFAETFTMAAPTTTATRHRILRAASGQGHDGTRSGAGVTVLPTGTGHICTVDEKFFQCGSGMLFETFITANTSDECFRIGNSGENAEGTLIEKAILWQNGVVLSVDGVYAGNYAVGTASNPITIRNCAISGMTRAAVHPQQFLTSGSDDHHFDVINCTITDCDIGIAHRARPSLATIFLKIINTIVGDSSTADYASSGSESGTMDTTGSTENWDEKTQIPGKHADSPMVLLTAASAGGSECLIISKYDNVKLVDSGDNDVLDDGVGPASNALVPTDDIVGVTRSGTTCDPGAFEIAAAGDQNVTVAAIAAVAAVNAPAQINQTVIADTIPAASVAVAPTLGLVKTVSVGAIAAAAVVNAPAQVDQTVIAAALPAVAAVVAPTIGVAGAQNVDVAAIAAAAAVNAPAQIDQTVLMSAIAARARQRVLQVSQTVLVSAIAASAAIVAPLQLNQTVPVDQLAASAIISSLTITGGVQTAPPQARSSIGNAVQSGPIAGNAVQSGPTRGNAVQSGPEAGNAV